MALSYAAGIWIPGCSLDSDILEAVLGDFNGEDELQFYVCERQDLEVTFMWTPLDDSLGAEFSTLDEAAAELAQQLRRRTYALFAFFGSADWIQVTAFSKTGRERWVETSDEDRAPTKKMVAVGKELGLRVAGADGRRGRRDVPPINGVDYPYWRLMSEVKGAIPEDILGIGVKPAFDLDENWTDTAEFFVGDEVDDHNSPSPEQEKYGSFPESVGPVLKTLKVGDRFTIDSGAAEVVSVVEFNGELIFDCERLDGNHEFSIYQDELKYFEPRRLKE